MRGSLNINQATQDDLMIIKDIGEQRSKNSLKAGSEGGSLTLEDLKSLHGIPSTMWDPLVTTGKIIFEDSEETISKDNEEKMVKLKQDFDIKVLLLEQQLKTMQHDH